MQLEVRPDPSEVGRARRWARSRLAGSGIRADEPLAETLVLLVSELVTNAVRHSHARPVALRLVRADTLLCEVDDDDHELPALKSAGPGDETGRGLRVVSTLAREWGASRTGAGKTVWFELTLPARHR